MATRTETKIAYLKQVFNGSDELIRDLERATHMQDFAKNQLIAGPQINCENIYILQKGSVNVYFVLDGKKIIVDMLKPGDIFGDVMGIGARSKLCEDSPFLEAREDSVICVSVSSDFYRVLQRYPALSLQVLQNVASRLARAERKIQDLALRTVGERIVRELSRLAEIEGENNLKFYRLDGTITHEQLAMMVGATRETVTKALTLLRSRGIVEMEKNHYIINKPMALPSFSVKK